MKELGCKGVGYDNAEEVVVVLVADADVLVYGAPTQTYSSRSR